MVATAAACAAALLAGCNHSASAPTAPMTIVVPPVAAEPRVESAAVAVEASSRPPVAQQPVTSFAIAPALEAKLRSGVPVHLVVALEGVGAQAPPSGVPVGSCVVTFDLWDEVFRVRLPTGVQHAQPRAVVYVDALVRQCTDSQAYDAALASVPAGTRTQLTVREP